MKTAWLLAIALAVGSPLAVADQTPQQQAKEAARSALLELDWRSVVAHYQSLRDQSQPATPDWNEATLGLATGYQQLQPPGSGTIEQARALYQELADQSKDPQYIARALMSLGRIDELQDYLADPVDLEAARKRYLEVVQRFPDLPVANEAVLRAAASLVMTYDAPDFQNVKQGLQLLEDWLGKHPKNPLASLMWQYAGDAYFMPLKDNANALRCYQEVDRLGWVDPQNQGPWYWRSAKLAEMLNKPAVAAGFYRKVILVTPTGGKAYEASLWLQKNGFEVPVSPSIGPLLTPADLAGAPATQPATVQPATPQSTTSQPATSQPATTQPAGGAH